MVFIENIINIHTDFLSIVSTASPDDVLALLLAYYVVFELNFPKNGRAIRFLYAIVFGDTRFLSNKMRSLIKEKDIEIYAETNRKTFDYTNLVSNSPLTVIRDSQSSPQSNVNLSSRSIENVDPLNNNNLNVNTAIASKE